MSEDNDHVNEPFNEYWSCCPAHLFRITQGLSYTDCSVPTLVHIKKTETIIGRDRNTVDVYLDSKNCPRTISRIHASIVYLNNQWRIRDQYSVNGVYVNDFKVYDSVLMNGDILVFGRGLRQPAPLIAIQNSLFTPLENATVSNRMTEMVFSDLTPSRNNFTAFEKSEFKYIFRINQSSTINMLHPSLDITCKEWFGNSIGMLLSSSRERSGFSCIDSEDDTASEKPKAKIPQTVFKSNDSLQKRRPMSSMNVNLLNYKSQVKTFRIFDEYCNDEVIGKDDLHVEMRFSDSGTCPKCGCSDEVVRRTKERILSTFYSEEFDKEDFLSDVEKAKVLAVENAQDEGLINNPVLCWLCGDFLINPIELSCKDVFCSECFKLYELEMGGKTCCVSVENFEEITSMDVVADDRIKHDIRYEVLGLSYTATAVVHRTRKLIETILSFIDMKKKEQIVDRLYARIERINSYRFKQALEEQWRTGVRSPSITELWSYEEKSNFASKFRMYQSNIRNIYCQSIGLEPEWLERATTLQLIIACDNLRELFSHICAGFPINCAVSRLDMHYESQITFDNLLKNRLYALITHTTSSPNDAFFYNNNSRCYYVSK